MPSKPLARARSTKPQQCAISTPGLIHESCRRNSPRARSLEPISKPFEEDHETCKLDKAEEIVGVVLPANEDPALPLNPGKEALDGPASHIAG